MKKALKAVSVLAALTMSAGILSGCGAKDDTLIMGTNAAFVPFEFVTTNGTIGEFDGVDVVIATKIAEKAGKEVKIEDMEFDGLIAALSSGKVDFIAAGMSVTEERKQNVDFSTPYYAATQVMLVPEASAITCAEDLKDGKSVGVVLGYTGDTVVTEDLQIPEDKIVRANRAIDITQDVVNGKLDAVVMDKTTGEALAEKTGLKVVEDAEAFDNEEYAIAVKKGNTELLETINGVLEEMMEKGEIEELVEKYSNAE